MHHPWHLLGDMKCKLRIFYSNLMSNSVLRYWTEFRNSRKLFFLCSFSLFEAIQWSLCRKCNVWKLAVDQSVSFETQISVNKNTAPPPKKKKRKKKHCPHDSYLLCSGTVAACTFWQECLESRPRSVVVSRRRRPLLTSREDVACTLAALSDRQCFAFSGKKVKMTTYAVIYACRPHNGL